MKETDQRRDRTDDLIRRYLEDIEIPPPPGVWDRLERSLAETPSGAAVPRMKWWRRNIPALTAAAACLLLMLGLTWRLGNSLYLQNRPAQQIAEADSPDQQFAGVTPEVPAIDEVASLLAATPETATEATPTPLHRALNSLRAQPSVPSQKAAVETLTAEVAAQAEIIDTGTAPADSTATSAEAAEAAEAPRSHDRVRSTASAKRNPDWAAIAMDDGFRRRSARVTASVFAGNINGSSSMRTITGHMAQYSTLGIKEVADDIRTGNSQTIMSQPQTDIEALLSAPKVVTVPREEAVLKHRMPITAGVSVSVELSDRIAIESGLTYSYLRSVSDTKKHSTYNVRQDLHYVGIPLAINYYAINSNRWALYLRGGGALEKAVKAQRVTVISSNEGSSSQASEPLKVRGLQPSLNGAIGAEWRFARILSIYAEPGVSYYFERATQPDNYRTEHPVTFALRTGLRVSIRH